MSKWGRRFDKLRGHPRPVRFIIARLLWRAGLSPLLVTTMPRGFRLRFYPSAISAALWANPSSRSEDEDFVWATLRPGDRYVDAGANIGQLVLAAANRVGAEGEVFAIEAHPRVHGYLAGNVALNDAGTVHTIHCALGESDGEIAFTDTRSDDQNRVDRAGDVKVPMRALDDVVAPAQTRLLKIDVEGYELPVLRGALATLAVTDVIYCELSQSNCARFGYEPSDVEELLLECGFVFVRRDDAGGATVTREPYFATLAASAVPSTGYNMIAAKPSVADEIASLVSNHTT